MQEKRLKCFTHPNLNYTVVFFMSFNEIYSMLKSENIEEKICFVETGSFFVTIGSDAECLSDILELNKI